MKPKKRNREMRHKMGQNLAAEPLLDEFFVNFLEFALFAKGAVEQFKFSMS